MINNLAPNTTHSASCYAIEYDVSKEFLQHSTVTKQFNLYFTLNILYITKE